MTDETTAIVQVSPSASYLPTTWDEIMNVAQVFVQSGLFKDSRDVAKAAVKIMAGAELGFGPFASMNGIDIIDGKPAIGAGLITAMIDNAPHYTFNVERMDAKGCAIRFFKNGVDLGTYSFTEADANRAGLLSKRNWKNWPVDMYFNRAITGGGRKFCAGALRGGRIYTPEELGNDSDPDGNLVIESETILGPIPKGMVDPLGNNVSPPPDASVATAPVDWTKGDAASMVKPLRDATGLDTPTLLTRLAETNAQPTMTVDEIAALLNGGDPPAPTPDNGQDTPAPASTPQADHQARTTALIPQEVWSLVNDVLFLKAVEEQKDNAAKPTTNGQWRDLGKLFGQAKLSDDERHAVYKFLFDVTSAKKMTNAQYWALTWAFTDQDSKTLRPCAVEEIEAIVEAQLGLHDENKDAEQPPLIEQPDTTYKE